MTTARDIMSPDATCVDEHANLVDAAKRMRDLGVGALPICGDDGRLQGMRTDRGIVVKAIAGERELSTTTAGELLHRGVGVPHLPGLKARATVTARACQDNCVSDCGR